MLFYHKIGSPRMSVSVYKEQESGNCSVNEAGYSPAIPDLEFRRILEELMVFSLCWNFEDIGYSIHNSNRKDEISCKSERQRTKHIYPYPIMGAANMYGSDRVCLHQ